MFRFGRKYSEPNKNGRIYPELTHEEFVRIFNEVGRRLTEQARHGAGNFVIISSRLFDFKDKFKFGR